FAQGKKISDAGVQPVREVTFREYAIDPSSKWHPRNNLPHCYSAEEIMHRDCLPATNTASMGEMFGKNTANVYHPTTNVSSNFYSTVGRNGVLPQAFDQFFETAYGTTENLSSADYSGDKNGEKMPPTAPATSSSAGGCGREAAAAAAEEKERRRRTESSSSPESSSGNNEEKSSSSKPESQQATSCSFAQNIKEENSYCLYDSDKCPKGAAATDLSTFPRLNAEVCPMSNASGVPVPGYFRLSQAYGTSKSYNAGQIVASQFTPQPQVRFDAAPSLPSVPTEAGRTETEEASPNTLACVSQREEDAQKEPI
ncbi:unnamed protein product, partial [Caretta caretta]